MFIFQTHTKRDELSFLTVLAFPNASKIGFVAKTDSCEVILLSALDSFSDKCAKYFIINFAASVLPEPLSPLSKQKQNKNNFCYNNVFHQN